MPVTHRLITFFSRYGAPVKFAVKQLMPVLLPGSPAVAELVVELFDCVHESATDNQRFEAGDLPDASDVDLARVEQVLEVMETRLGTLLGQLAQLEDVPQAAARVAETAIASDHQVREAVVQLGKLAAGFERMEAQNRRILKGQGNAADALHELLGMQRHSAALEYARFIEELEGLPAEKAEERLGRFQQALGALGNGAYQDAAAPLRVLLEQQPESAATRVVLAITEAVRQDWPNATRLLGQARQLRPGDRALEGLYQDASQYSRRTTLATDARRADSAQVGSELGGWRLEQRLGQGGWGQVFLASRDGRQAALKVMRPELGRDPALVSLFKQEIKALIRLHGSHSNVVRIEDFDKDAAGCWYLVMEYVEGESLETRLARGGAIAPEEALPMFQNLAAGLATVHQHGVVHRDIKPANIVLRAADSSPVLVDFGIAAGAGGGPTVILPAGYTPRFGAPEVVHGGQADARSDVYCLVASLYYAVAYADEQAREPWRWEPKCVPTKWRPWMTAALDGNPSRRPVDGAQLVWRMSDGSEDGLGAPASSLNRRTSTRHGNAVTEVPGGGPRVKLRAESKALSDEQVESMFKECNFFARKLNVGGRFDNDLVNYGHGVLIDRATGLMWQQGGSTKKRTYEEASVYVRDLNRRAFTGYRDWCLPTLEQAASLLESEKRRRNMYIDPVFDHTVRMIWTSDTTGDGAAWVVHFRSGIVAQYDSDFRAFVRVCRTGKGNAMLVRRVKLGAEPRDLSDEQVDVLIKNRGFFTKGQNENGQFDNDLVDHDDGTLTDRVTGVMWQRGGSSEAMAYEATERCVQFLNDEGFAGYRDWRLPTLEEAASLLEPKHDGPGRLFIRPGFERTQRWIWTSDGKGSGAWVVSFGFGRVYRSESGGNYFVRACRTA